uniref:Uncharacterized protein n=1 Tax=Eutreptiella gymnastica TaxID=73025 RepID=A0A7S4LCE5_9EUGL
MRQRTPSTPDPCHSFDTTAVRTPRARVWKCAPGPRDDAFTIPLDSMLVSGLIMNTHRAPQCITRDSYCPVLTFVLTTTDGVLVLFGRVVAVAPQGQWEVRTSAARIRCVMAPLRKHCLVQAREPV